MTVFEPVPDPGVAVPPRHGPPLPSPPSPASPSGPADPAAPAGLPSAHPTASFWLQTPSPLLHGFRSSPQLPTTADVVIVGSGITGAFAADALLAGGGSGDGGLSVLMLDAREASWGATGRNGGHCQPQLYGRAPGVAAFELATYRFLRRFAARHAVPCDWRSLPGGGVHAYLDADLFAAAADVVAALQTADPALGRLVRVVAAGGDGGDDDDDKELTARLRLCHGVAAGAVVQRHAASLWPYRLVAWVLERLVRTAPAFNLQTNTPVLQLRRRRRRRHLQQQRSDHPWIVATPRGPVAARAVLLATNGYTSHLVPALADLIVPVRGQVAALRPPGEGPSPAVVPAPRLAHSYILLGHDSPGHRDRDEYLIQRAARAADDPHAAAETAAEKDRGSTAAQPGGLLIFGGGRQRAAGRAVGEWRDDAVEPDVARYLRTHLASVVDVGAADGAHGHSGGGDDDGSEGGLRPVLEWTGIMGFSRDEHPWVGQVPPSLLGGLLSEEEEEEEEEEETQGRSGRAEESTGLYLCAGYTGHGMPVAALAARAVARTIRADLGIDSSAVDAYDEDDEDNDDEDLGPFKETAVPLPASFRITEARIRQARAAGSDTVSEGDAKGHLYALQQQLRAAAAAGTV